MNSIFFAVIVGTQAPFGFTALGTACEFAAERPRARIYSLPAIRFGACYAIENGCELAEAAAQSRGERQMVEVACAREERRESVWVAYPKSGAARQ